MTECEKGRADSRQMSEADDAGWPGENAVYQAAYFARHNENSREGEGTRRFAQLELVQGSAPG